MHHEIKSIKKLKFPHGFLWGTATSAYQTEGNNTNSDWWAWENSIKRHNELISKGLNPKDFFSGIACDSYNRYDEDFSLAEHLGHNAIRIGIEWSRIEPREGGFVGKELEHYEKVLQSAKAHGLTTFVTLHHFSNPLWFMKKGGFTREQNVQNFVRFVEIATRRLSENVDFWITINEPEIYSTASYLIGKYPPQEKSLWVAFKVVNNLIKAHNLAANFIRHNIRKPVSMAFHLSDFQPWGFFGDFAASITHYFANEYILKRTINQCDFIGVNYYNHHHVGILGLRKKSHSKHDVTDLGWSIHPEGLERVLVNLKKYHKPIYVTENGLADHRDKKREKFIKEHLYYLHNAIMKGADVRGYLHWSLIDNFEWSDGYGPRFGLIEIDRDDLLRRKVRYSATKFAEICRNNYLEY